MIGIFGGTFDPIHYGHLRAAVEVQALFGLSEIRLIPSATPPHRDRPAATAAQRRDMLMLAVEQRPGLIVDSRELERPGASYMIDTLLSIRQDCPHQPLLLCIGADAFNHLQSWHRWRHLFDYAHIVVLTRPGFATPTLAPFFSERWVNEKQPLTQTAAGKLYFQAITSLDISATAIRRMIACRQNPVFLLPDAVIEYIQHHGLYGAR